MKKHLIVAAGLLLLGTGCAERHTDPQEYGYRYDFSLVATDIQGKERTVPLDLDSGDPWAPPRIVVSPDKKLVAYANWENAHYVIRIADLPNGENARIVAGQSVPEGHGALKADTLTWIDERTLFYQEVAAPCGETGEPSLQNPTKDCDGSILLTQRVDIVTGEKFTEKSMQTIKPLQP